MRRFSDLNTFYYERKKYCLLSKRGSFTAISIAIATPPLPASPFFPKKKKRAGWKAGRSRPHPYLFPLKSSKVLNNVTHGFRAELHKRKDITKKKSHKIACKIRYVQQKIFNKTLFLQEETQNIGVKKKTKFCILCLGKILLKIVLV